MNESLDYRFDFKYSIEKKGKRTVGSNEIMNYVLFILSGELYVNCNQLPDHHFKEGELLLLPSFSSWEIKSLCQAVVLIMRIRTINQNNSFLESLYLHIHKSGYKHNYLPINHSLKNYLESLAGDLRSKTDYSVLEKKKESTLSFLIDKQYKKPQIAKLFYPAIRTKKEFEEFIWKNYLFVKSIKQFAELAGCSEVVFKRKFNYYFAETYYNWSNRQRSIQIIDKLSTNRRSFKQIYLELGFSSANSFYKFCKRQFKASPTELSTIIKGI